MINKAMFMPGLVPKGGVCISSFIVAEREGKVLVGKMRNPEIWVEKFLVGREFAPKYAASGKWLLPASHLKFGESPNECAKRILNEQLLAGELSCTLVGVQSHLSGDAGDVENAHWDLCIVYRALVPEPIHVPEWFSELRYIPIRGLRTSDFTRGHGDVLEQLGLLERQ